MKQSGESIGLLRRPRTDVFLVPSINTVMFFSPYWRRTWICRTFQVISYLSCLHHCSEKLSVGNSLSLPINSVLGDAKRISNQKTVNSSICHLADKSLYSVIRVTEIILARIVKQQTITLKMLVKITLFCAYYCRSILQQSDTFLDFSFPSSCNRGKFWH